MYQDIFNVLKIIVDGEKSIAHLISLTHELMEQGVKQLLFKMHNFGIAIVFR